MAASTAAALMRTAAARRLSHYASTSAMVLREVSGSHKLTINGCQPSKKFDQGWAWDSKPFRVGGHSWRIRYCPHGDEEGHISLYLELDRGSAIDAARDVTFKFSVLDQSGNPVPKLTRAMTEPCSFPNLSWCHGFRDFIRWEDLEASGCLKDDTFTVQCDVTHTTDLGAAATFDDDAAATPATAAAAAPAPKLHGEHHLTELLWKQKRGADVTVDVGGGEVTFDAHGWLLAERSPVLKAELELLALNSKKSSAGAQRRIEIKGVDPKVFKAVLHYMYTNAVPEMEEDDGDDAMAMAQGLLAAADRFKVDGLKLACEETLSKRIDVSTAAGILAVAEQHGCGALKTACLEFLMARPENLKAVMETEGYGKARAIVQPLVMELGMKQWLAFIGAAS
ncbi:unnamed protein product [Urochloa decumbens]|uniref:Uncharacterized protein n=1 Tax=Urochloa decumbens TaxID=240449 RepID=A0ABC8VXG4_9POAL